MNHIRSIHSHEPDFFLVCGIQGCQRSYKVFSSYITHLNRHHKEEFASSDYIEDVHAAPPTVANDINVDPLNEAEQDTIVTQYEPVSIERSVALLILSLREKHKLPVSTANAILKEISALWQIHEHQLTTKLQELLAHHPDNIDQLDISSDVLHHLSALSSEHEQLKYFRCSLGLVEPQSHKISIDSNDTLQYVPIIDSLQCLLKHNDVLAHVVNFRYCPPEGNDHTVLTDFSNGSLYKENPLFGTNDPTIQIILYHDDFQITNPLGSRPVKISAFYYVLGNLGSCFRSTLQVIQLACLCRSELVKKHGYGCILKPVIRDLKILEQDGISLNINGSSVKVKGTVSFVACDNLAAHAIGGFVESFVANRFCRQCMCTRTILKNNHTPTQLSKVRERCIEGYDRQVELVADDKSLVSVYGVKAKSPLNELQYFHVINGLPPDPAHDLLEGVCPWLLQKILTYLKDQKVLDIADINAVLTTFEYKGSDKVNRPSKFLSVTNVKQTASQLWNLMRFFPLQFYSYIQADNESTWELLLLLGGIVDVVMSPRQCSESIALMHTLITDFVELLQDVFGQDCMIPKVHFLVHYPSLTAKFGPLYFCSTLRFEAKHSYFKSIARQTKNMKNICFTLAKRHQLLQCYQNSSSNFLVNDMLMGKSCTIDMKDLHESLQLLLVPLGFQDGQCQTTSSVSIHGTKYCKNMFVCVAVEQGLCQFAQITMIILKHVEAFFVCNRWETLSYDKKRHAYIINVIPGDERINVMKQRDFISYYPLHCYQSNGQNFIVLKHFVIEELL